MTIPNTYNGLVSSLAALAEDDSQEFLNYIPTAIFLTEERMFKELDTDGIEAFTSVTAVAGNPLLAKPTGYRVGLDISYRTSSGIQHVIKRGDDYLRDYWPVNASSSAHPNGVPKYFADRGPNSFTLAPIPASAYQFEILHTKPLTHLSAGNQTNYYTDECPDALFYGTMSNMCEFLKDYGTQQVWETKYVNAMTAVNNEGMRARQPGSGIPSDNPRPSENTLKGTK